MGMTGTRLIQEVKIIGVQMEVFAPKGKRKIGRSLPVVGVMALVFPLGIVQHGKELDDFGFGSGRSRQPQSVLQNSRPMGDSVNFLWGQDVLIENGFDQGTEVEHGPANQWNTVKKNEGD